MFEQYNLNDLVVPGFPALFEAFYIQEELTKLYAPKVFQALVCTECMSMGAERSNMADDSTIANIFSIHRPRWAFKRLDMHLDGISRYIQQELFRTEHCCGYGIFFCWRGLTGCTLWLSPF